MVTREEVEVEHADRAQVRVYSRQSKNRQSMRTGANGDLQIYLKLVCEVNRRVDSRGLTLWDDGGGQGGASNSELVGRSSSSELLSDSLFVGVYWEKERKNTKLPL